MNALNISSATPNGNEAQAVAVQNQDYSAQWAEYYRAYGMHKEAEMIEQMAKQMKQVNINNNLTFYKMA